VVNTSLLRRVLVLAVLGCIQVQVHACTVFVLTDANQTLFCNNEDWSNPKTRIWFVPAGKDYYGCAYVGFDNGWAQGGLNTEGLAFDWVAGYQEVWAQDSNLPTPRGNPSQRMLESCATVEEAVAFYRRYWESSFSYAKILVADRTGASVVIGARDGRLHVDKADICRGFGSGGRTLDRLLSEAPEISAAGGFRILKACIQLGTYATKYSCVYDLKKGDIFLLPHVEGQSELRFSLAAELQKGGHYYDMPQVKQQLGEAQRPLLTNMRRFLMDSYKPIPDGEPQVTAHLIAMERDMYSGTMRAGDYTADVWKELSSDPAGLKANLKQLGAFVSMTLVDRSEENGLRGYRYRLEFEKVTVLQRILLDTQNRLTSSESEDAIWKASASTPYPTGASRPVNLAGQRELPSGKGLAVAYPADAGIRADPHVIFADDFESGPIGERWDEVRNDHAKVLSLVEPNAAGLGHRCLRVEAHLGQDMGGGLTKWFEPVDQVFIRFYTEFDPTCDYVHHFVTLRANKGLQGGDKWSGFGGAGLKPEGSERFSTAIEPWGDWGRVPPPGLWNFYSYWHQMKVSPDGKYWGNSFDVPDAPAIQRGRWICVELMLKHNTPGEPDGEQAFWIDGVLLGHWKGINWRTTSGLKANALTLESYVTDRWTKNPVNGVSFDNLVIARRYIGPD
jgi:hypothetical protein